jgi:hypothetical protein
MNAIKHAVVPTRRPMNISHQEVIRRVRVFILSIATLMAAPAALYAQIDVTQNRYDAGRSGVNLKETTLTAANGPA